MPGGYVPGGYMYSPGYDCPGIYVAAVFGFPQPYAARVYACPELWASRGLCCPDLWLSTAVCRPGLCLPGSCGLPRIYVATTFGFPQPCAARVYACPGVEGVPGYVFPPGIHGLSALSLFISGIFLSAGVWAGPPGVWQSCSHKPVCFFVSFFAFVSFLFCVFLSSAAGLWL